MIEHSDIDAAETLNDASDVLRMIIEIENIKIQYQHLCMWIETLTCLLYTMQLICTTPGDHHACIDLRILVGQILHTRPTHNTHARVNTSISNSASNSADRM